MDMRPNIARLATLDLSGFEDGTQVMFCPECPWQAPGPQGMKPVCPECGARLHVVRNDKDLRAVVKRPS